MQLLKEVTKRHSLFFSFLFHYPKHMPFIFLVVRWQLPLQHGSHISGRKKGTTRWSEQCLLQQESKMFIDAPHKLLLLLYWPELDHMTNSGGQYSEDGSIFDEARFYHKVRAPLVRKKGKINIC